MYNLAEISALSNLSVSFHEQVCITSAQQMVKNIMNIILHRYFPYMVPSGSSVVLVSCLQSTFRKSSNWRLKSVDELMSMAEKPVDTLSEGNLTQRWGCELGEQFSCFVLKKVGCLALSQDC